MIENNPEIDLMKQADQQKNMTENKRSDQEQFEGEGMNTVALTTLLNSGVEEALLSLSPTQLLELERNVSIMNKQTETSSKRKKTKKKTTGQRRRSFGGQYLNLPASTPVVEIRNNKNWMLFTYSTKGKIQEYEVLIEGMENVQIENIPFKFKEDNCVYPRAMCLRREYTGNRWDYETKVNELSWKLCWMNPSVLCGKRGLIQRAVDSYRNRRPDSRSRRVVRQERITCGNIKTKHTTDEDSQPKTMVIQSMSMGEVAKTRLRIDIESVSLDLISDEFKKRNSIYSFYSDDKNIYNENSSQRLLIQDYVEIGWKLAFLNQSKLDGSLTMIQKAVESYQTRNEKTQKEYVEEKRMKTPNVYGEYQSEEKNNEELRDMVEKTLQQAMADGLDVGLAHGLDDATILAVLQHAQIQMQKEEESS